MNKSENIIKENIENIKEQIRQGKDLSEIYDEMKDSLDVDFDEFKIICKKIYNENKTNSIKQEQPQNISKTSKKEAWEIRPAFNFVSFITNDMWAKTKILLWIKLFIFFISIIIGFSVIGFSETTDGLKKPTVYISLMGQFLFTLLITLPFWGFVLTKLNKNKIKANKGFTIIFYIIIFLDVISLFGGYSDYKKIKQMNNTQEQQAINPTQQTQQSTSTKNEEKDSNFNFSNKKVTMKHLFVGDWYYERHIQNNKIVPIFKIFSDRQELILNIVCKKPKNEDDFGFSIYIDRIGETRIKTINNTIFYNTDKISNYKKIEFTYDKDKDLKSKLLSVNKKDKSINGANEIIDFMKDLSNSNTLFLNYELDNEKKTTTFNIIGFNKVFNEIYEFCGKNENEEDALIQSKLNQLEVTKNNFQRINKFKSNDDIILNIETNNLHINLGCSVYMLNFIVEERINKQFINQKTYVKIKNHWEEFIFHKDTPNTTILSDSFSYRNNSIEPQEFKRRQNLANIVEHLKYNNKLLLATKINDNFYLDELDLSSIRKEFEPILNQCSL